MNKSSFLFASVFLILAAAPFIADAGFFGPSNYHECILDEMPGTKNNIVAREIRRKCSKDFPSQGAITKKSSLFGVDTAGECIIKYGEDVSSKHAASSIRRACRNLYRR